MLALALLLFFPTLHLGCWRVALIRSPTVVPPNVFGRRRHGIPPTLPSRPTTCARSGLSLGRYASHHTTVALGSDSKQIFMGRPPLFGLTETAVHSMLSGARPPRPGHQDVSDQVWCMIERCWQSVTSKSVLAGEVVDLLEGELRRISDSST